MNSLFKRLLRGCIDTDKAQQHPIVKSDNQKPVAQTPMNTDTPFFDVAKWREQAQQELALKQALEAQEKQLALQKERKDKLNLVHEYCDKITSILAANTSLAASALSRSWSSMLHDLKRGDDLEEKSINFLADQMIKRTSDQATQDDVLQIKRIFGDLKKVLNEKIVKEYLHDEAIARDKAMAESIKVENEQAERRDQATGGLLSMLRT